MRLRIRMLRSMRQSIACRPTGAGEKSKASATQSSSRNSQSTHVWPERGPGNGRDFQKIHIQFLNFMV